MALINDGIPDIVSEVVDLEMNAEMTCNSSSRQHQLIYARYFLKSVYSDANQRMAVLSADYSQTLYRSAYLYRYFITHIYMMKKFFGGFVGEKIRDIVTNNDSPLRVCSIGGGPGSDLFGLLLHLAEESTDVRISGAVLDLYPDWKNTFLRVASKIDPASKYLQPDDIQYVRYDFFKDTVSEEVLKEIRAADVITMVKFVSAVMADKDLCQERLQWILTKMKPGALLLVVDNSGGESVEQVNEVAEITSGMRLLHQKTKVKFVLPAAARNIPLDVQPLQSTSVSMALWQKADYDVERLFLVLRLMLDSRRNI